jgi:hypothetical protein
MIKKIIILIAVLISINSFAQKDNVSPYSFFGIGDINETKSVSELNMGGIGGAQNSFYRLSFTNPASYSELRLTTYAISGSNKFIMLDDGNDKQESSSFQLNYLVLGFPVGKNAGMAFGIQPNSKVGYSLLDEFTNTFDLTESNLFFGEGGTNRIFLGYGYKFPHNINVGAEVSYIFGNSERNILNRVENVQLGSIHQVISEIRGASVKLGIQNQTKLKEKLTLKTGLALTLENDLTQKGDEYLFSLLNTSTPDFISARDTIVSRNFKGSIKTPLKTVISAGLGEENKWFAGVEYSFQNALDFQESLVQNSATVQYVKSNRLSIGGFFTPKAESLTNYWKRVTYRAGLHVSQTGLEINNTEVNDFGISFGVSLPSRKKLSNINLGFDIGKRGEINSSLVKENYFNFRLSLSLNDRWFKKRKLD